MACFGKCGPTGMIAGTSQINGLAIVVFIYLFIFFNFIGSHIKKKKIDDLRIPFLLNLLGMFFERHKFLKTCSFFLINEHLYIYNYVIVRLKISMIETFNLFTDFERSICLLYIICATISSAIENVNFQN